MDTLTIDHDRTVDYTVLRLGGLLSLCDVPRTRNAMVKSLLDSPCVLVDLSRLSLTQGICAQVFPSALSLAGNWPWSKLALFGASSVLSEQLLHHRITATVPLASGAGTAWARVQDRPDRVRLTRVFRPEASEPRRARAMVREVTEAWDLPEDLEEVAHLVITELVTNAVEHAGTSCRVTVELSPTSLGIRVRDWFSARLPRLRTRDPEAVRGRGLQLVDTLTRNWGVARHVDGKMVWAHIDVP